VREFNDPMGSYYADRARDDAQDAAQDEMFAAANQRRRMATLILDAETIYDSRGLSEADALTIVEYAIGRNMDVAKYAATCPALARVVLVGMINADTGDRIVTYDSSLVDIAPTANIDATVMPRDGEADLLTSINRLLGGYSTLAGFNLIRFDIPLLILRSWRHGIAPAPILLRAARQRPWDEGPAIDVMHRLSFGDPRSTYPLAVYGLGLGVGSPKTHGDGSSVADLVASRDGVGLATYCLGDVDVTHALAVKAGVLKPQERKAA